MAKMKSTKKYYFTVEGETEQWYLQWLQKIINESPNSKYKVSFDCAIQKDPLKRAKAITVLGKTDIYHISDYESDEEIHVKQFKETMDRMKAAQGLGRQISYKFGYTNLTFDLWIILHKMDCNGPKTHRKHYVEPINRAYDERFENMDAYKHEANFKKVLSKNTLEDVILAVDRARKIMERNKQNGYILHNYKGYSYYKENPSLAIGEIIEKILRDCGLI